MNVGIVTTDTHSVGIRHVLIVHVVLALVIIGMLSIVHELYLPILLLTALIIATLTILISYGSRRMLCGIVWLALILALGLSTIAIYVTLFAAQFSHFHGGLDVKYVIVMAVSTLPALVASLLLVKLHAAIELGGRGVAPIKKHPRQLVYSMTHEYFLSTVLTIVLIMAIYAHIVLHAGRLVIL